MYIVTVDFLVEKNRLQAFREAMIEQASNSLQREAGCLRFDVACDPQRPELIFLYEIYQSREAFDLHLLSPHFKAFDARVKDWVAEKKVRQFQLLWPLPSGG